jgi:hypothetical protein
MFWVFDAPDIGDKPYEVGTSQKNEKLTIF